RSRRPGAVDAPASAANVAPNQDQRELRMAQSPSNRGDSPTVSEEFAKKFATEKDTPYLRFIRGEGLEVISAQYVRNLRTVELKPWARRGGSGVFINHDASRTSNDCYVCAIPEGGALAPQRQLFEEMILILDGRGWTRGGNR